MIGLQLLLSLAMLARMTLKSQKTICLCDDCGKQHPITVRVKSKVINGQLNWLCPSCVGKRMCIGNKMILELLAAEARQYNDCIRVRFGIAHISIFMHRESPTLMIDQVDDSLIISYIDPTTSYTIFNKQTLISKQSDFEQFIDAFSLGLCMLVHHIKWENRKLIDQLDWNRIQLFA